MPHEHDAVLFTGRVRLNLRARGNALCVGYLSALASAVKLPVVERAADRTTFHHATVTEVRAKMRAIGIEHIGFAIVAAKHDEFLAEVLYRLDLAHRQVF